MLLLLLSGSKGWLSTLLFSLLLWKSCSGRRIQPNQIGGNHTTTFDRFLNTNGEKVEVPIPSSPDDHLVRNLPLLDEESFPTDHWAGLLPASDDGHKYLFYWLFAPNNPGQKPDEDIPLIIWLNGGPACSSMDGLWLENGPFRLTQSSGKWSIEIDDFSWHNAPAYVVYIDQPVGTGISFTTNGNYPSNDHEVNVDFYYFLTKFLQLHSDKFLMTPPSLADEEDSQSSSSSSSSSMMVKRPFYFSGESHAGHYIPSMMNYIQKQNAKDPEVRIPLSGAAIGNGWIDPVAQYSAHEAAYGYGLIGLAQKRALALMEQQCQADLKNKKYFSNVCFDLLDKVVRNSLGQNSGYKVSTYDQRKWEVNGQARDFPPGHKDVESYLGGGGKVDSDFSDVLEAIHSTPSKLAGQRYRECTDPPYNALKHQDGLGVTEDVVDLLNAGVRLLFFNGIHDLICNHVGNEIAVENFAWQHQSEYQQAKRYGWKSSSIKKLAGYMKEYENLMFMKVLNSGHMVPMDVPDVSLDMMRTLVFQGDFDNFEQALDRAPKGADDHCSGGGNKDCPVCPAAASTSKECPTCPAAGDDACQTVADAFSLNMLGLVAVLLAGLMGCVGCGYLLCCRSPRSTTQKYEGMGNGNVSLELPQHGRFRDDDVLEDGFDDE